MPCISWMRDFGAQHVVPDFLHLNMSVISALPIGAPESRLIRIVPFGSKTTKFTRKTGKNLESKFQKKRKNSQERAYGSM